MAIRQLFRRKSGKQRGIVLVLIVVALTSVLGLAGLALDFGVAFLTKSRIQNALDAAALSGAKSLKALSNFNTARADAQTAFNQYLGELNRQPIALQVEFSSQLAAAAFTTAPGPTDNRFVRVSMPEGYAIPTYLTRVFPGVGDTLTLSGSAVAGAIAVSPPPEVCDLVPIIADSPPDPVTGQVDTNCSDGACFGYTVGQPYLLKEGATAGPGNFNLLSDSGPGGKDLRIDLAGGSARCRTAAGTVQGVGEVLSQPGAVNGPFVQGIETRLGIYKGGGLSAADYPPDVNTNSFTSYADYKAAVAAGQFTNPPPTGRPGRRLIRIAFADFSLGPYAGRSNIPTTGLGCFFILEPVAGQGNAGGNGNNASLSPGGDGNTTEDAFVAAMSRPIGSLYRAGGYGAGGRLIKTQKSKDDDGGTKGGGNDGGNGGGKGGGNDGGNGGGNGGFVSACDALADYKGQGPQRICAEFTLDCNLPNGGINGDAVNDSTFFKIVLYKDPSSAES